MLREVRGEHLRLVGVGHSDHTTAVQQVHEQTVKLEIVAREECLPGCGVLLVATNE